MFDDQPDVVDVNVLCKMLGISKKTAYRLLQESQIPYRRIGRVYRIRKEDIISFISGS